MTTPAEIYDYDMASRAADPAQAPGDPSGHDPADYVTTRSWRRRTTARRCRSRSCIAADFALDGTAPLLLYGYGSYGIAMPASFSANRLSLVDRGFVYAIAHIRGGSDKGWGWYLDGKREKKTNTFDDFVAGGARADRRRLHLGRAHRRPRRQRRRHADGRRRQPRGRALRRHRRRGALRRRAEHHARRHAAADAAGMARMGQPDHRRDGFRYILLLLALRQRRGPATIRRSWRWPA